jgi:hypothetical protein
MSQIQIPEPYPVDEAIKVLKGKDVYKNKKWWCAVLLVEAFEHKKVMVYMWQNKEKKRNEGGQWIGTGVFGWKIQQKMGINFQQNWNDIKIIVDEFMKEVDK